MSILRPRSSQTILRGLTSFSATLALALIASANPKEAPPEPGARAAPAKDEPRFLRVQMERDAWIKLQISSLPMRATRADLPLITLVGVAHIADATYYGALEEVLAEAELVLYESVTPAGTGGAGGETEAERRASTQAAMDFLAGLIERFQDDRGEYPADLNSLKEFAGELDPRFAAFVTAAQRGGWGEPIRYERTADGDQLTNPDGYRLISFAADQKEGGVDDDADLITSHRSGIRPFTQSAEGNLQVQLADALSLAFQLDTIDYGKPNWRVSDLSIDQVQRALEARGSDFSLLGDTLDGLSMEGRIARVLLGALKLADGLLDGRLSDTFKIVLIEMLGDEKTIDASMVQLGEAFREVIIDERNQKVVDDLQVIIEREPEIESIAVLYGAGHMPDLVERLETQLGYEPGEPTWRDAIEVDLTASAMTTQELAQIRLMVRRLMRQMQQKAEMPKAETPK